MILLQGQQLQINCNLGQFPHFNLILKILNKLLLASAIFHPDSFPLIQVFTQQYWASSFMNSSLNIMITTRKSISCLMEKELSHLITQKEWEYGLEKEVNSSTRKTIYTLEPTHSKRDKELSALYGKGSRSYRSLSNAKKDSKPNVSAIQEVLGIKDSTNVLSSHASKFFFQREKCLKINVNVNQIMSGMSPSENVFSTAKIFKIQLLWILSIASSAIVNPDFFGKITNASLVALTSFFPLVLQHLKIAVNVFWDGHGSRKLDHVLVFLIP